MTKPTRAQAQEAARSFIRNRDRLGKTTTADVLMGLGRLFVFPPGTPEYAGAMQVGAIADFIQLHAVEIE